MVKLSEGSWGRQVSTQVNVGFCPRVHTTGSKKCHVSDGRNKKDLMIDNATNAICEVSDDG